MKKITNKTVFISGGSRGIGKALVRRFKVEGWWVATCATQRGNLANTEADLALECDVASVDQVKKALREILNHTDKIDVLVNNAGLAGGNSMSPESSDELWHRIIDVNLNGTYYVTKYFAPHLSDQKGRVINIASVLALKGVPDQTAYCAAKHGVLGFTRAMSHLLAPRRIPVNAVCPGWVRTDMAEERMKEIGITEKDFETQVPLGRFVEPDEVAEFIFFLATSEGSSMITGQALTIDGGAIS